MSPSPVEWESPLVRERGSFCWGSSLQLQLPDLDHLLVQTEGYCSSKACVVSFKTGAFL